MRSDVADIALASLAPGCEVRAVVGRADLWAFVEFPYALHRCEPLWVPPLRSEQRRLLDRKANPFYDFGDTGLFVARRRGKVVGRIAAVDNPRHRAAHGDDQGFFGLFECIDDPGVAAALFDAVAGWLRNRQLSSMQGPVNFSTNYECGMLIHGFDLPPSIQMPYNPVYYPGLMEACGFTGAMDLWAWELPIALHENARIMRLARYPETRPEIRIRPLALDDFDAEAATIRDIYNAAWEQNWGFTPMTAREFEALAKQLRPLLRSELGAVAEFSGKPVGFSLVLPDLAPALAAANGRLHTCGIPLGLVRLLRARRGLDRVRVIATGMLEEYRNQGIDLLMSTELCRAARRLGYQTAEVSWVLAENDRANRVLGLAGAHLTKKYRIFERPV
jgi:GNAT superfamily N-acetyltransferase